MVRPLSFAVGDQARSTIHSAMDRSQRSSSSSPPALAVLFSEPKHKENENVSEATFGSGPRGWGLLIFALLINVWLFSIPTEFRRAKNCSVEEVQLYPDSNCMTTEMWVEGIAEYYRNGGGLHFDFSIEGRE